MSDKPNKVKRNKKDSQLLIRISTIEREQFLQLCEELDTSAAREIRQFIRAFIKQKTPIECRRDKEMIHVEENQIRRRKKGDLPQAGDQEARSQGREA
ncbi:hypothetical protein [Pelagibacterium lacus]|uniref:Uncharacterized protein n=1 Tax=Pelagibacterium lacus TaxID=2282655 RepID=A0A369VZL5_9HYPH|nr:hypothetical protein [Pelagibacterium lacus]RDE07583.1 hypothetical protein DVH29_15960 [Pelagibacterium lacus]